jgi:chloramphenicol 3-O phosphotransferase
MSGDNAAAPGKVIILNGAPRAGKSSIAGAIQETFDGVWLNFGVDRYKEMIPQRYQPGIGLRPGGEGPHLEPMILTLYQAMYDSIAVHCRRGVNIVADTGHHDGYSKSLGILPRCARLLDGYWVLFVGVRCPLDVVMRRRIATWGGSYGYGEGGVAPEPVQRWQKAVHEHGRYDMEIDTSVTTPEDAAAAIRARLDGPSPAAFRRLARINDH